LTKLLTTTPVFRAGSSVDGSEGAAVEPFPFLSLPVTQLGAPFKIVDGVVSRFRLEVAKRIAAIKTAAGLPVGAPLPAADRARVRTEVARELFRSEHGREQMDARELAGQIAKDSRPRTQMNPK
jgi:hypothetical protein